MTLNELDLALEDFRDRHYHEDTVLMARDAASREQLPHGGCYHIVRHEIEEQGDD